MRWLVLGLTCALGCSSEPAAPRGDTSVRDADAAADSASDAAPDVEDSGRTPDAALDSSAADAVPDADDATPPRDPFPDLAIGPYRSLLTMYVDSVRSNAGALDTSTTYAHSAGQGYLLQAIGEVLWAARDFALTERDELIMLAIGEIAELEASASLARGGGPAFGLTDAWDAFGDGSTNPAMTAYTWQSGMVALGVAKIARVLEDLGHADAVRVREFGVQLVQHWDPYYTSVTDGGYFWYSTEPSDAIAVHNTSVLVAMASQILSESGGPAALATRPPDCADLLWARTRGNPTSGYAWNYADDGLAPARRRAEDVSHALVTLQFMRFANQRGWWSNTQMQGVASTLRDTMWTGNPARLTGRVDGASGGTSEWTWTRAAVIGYAAHGDSPGGDPWVFDAARSLLFSSYLGRFERSFSAATVDSARLLAVALLLARRPAPFASGLGSAWERVAGPGDDAIPSASGGVRFYTVDWAPPAAISAGLTLDARAATAANANVLIDLEDGFARGAVVSVTYRSSSGGRLEQYDGTVYRSLGPMPATMDDGGTVRWNRSTFLLDASRYHDYQSGVVGLNVLLQATSPDIAIHRIEATPL